MVNGLSSMVHLRQNPLLSIGTRGESRGATQVNAYCQIPITGLNKNPCVMQQGGKPASLFSGTAHCRRRAVIPLLYNGSARIGLLARRGSPVQLGGPFGFCAFALLSDCGHCRPRAWLSGNRFEAYSSSSAFLDTIGRYSMTEEGGCQEENKERLTTFT
jgi:hypothetical protein